MTILPYLNHPTWQTSPYFKAFPQFLDSPLYNNHFLPKKVVFDLVLSPKGFIQHFTFLNSIPERENTRNIVSENDKNSGTIPWDSFHFTPSFLNFTFHSTLHFKKIPYFVNRKGLQMHENEEHSSSCWQNLPNDVISNILRRLNLTHRLRMSLVCKSWHATVLQNGLNSGPETPWLLLPQAKNSPDLSFYTLSEGKVLNIEAPISSLGGWCCGSSKGWIAFANGPKKCPQFALVNPISRTRIELPSLTSIPCFKAFVLELKHEHNISNFVQKIEVSSSHMGSGMIVAGIFGYSEVLAMCQPQDCQWTIFKGRNKDCFFEDMLFYKEALYTIMTGKIEKSTPLNHVFRFKDCTLTLKVLSAPYEGMDEAPEEEEYDQFTIVKKMIAKLYLAESISNELFMVVKYNDVFMNNSRTTLEYFRTSEFAILKIDIDNGNWDLAEGLEKQAVFVAMSGSFCVPECSFGMEKGNCVYFAADLEKIFDRYVPIVSRECGVYYIENGKIERSFPSVRLPMTSRMCWFLPTL